MKINLKKWFALAAAGMMACSMTSCADIVSKVTGMFGGNSQSENSVEEETNQPIILKNVTEAKNVILMIGDGMGPQQIKAGEVFKGEQLAMQGFPYKTTVETCSASAQITDSAAAATALATGVRTTNGVVGMDTELNELTTIVDIAHGLGKSTGILATEELYGATPMGFSGHASARGKSYELIQSAADSSNVNLFASYVIAPQYQSILQEAGYEKIDNVDAISEATSDRIFGSYAIEAGQESMTANGSITAFDRLVTEALEYLSEDPDGFFLMAEGSHIDHGGHNNNICYMLEELIAFDDAVQAVLEWAKDRDDTVVIVTADHETGGFILDGDATHEDLQSVYENGGMGGCYMWTTGGHTATDVNCYINGADIDFKEYSFGTNGRIKNTDVFEIMKFLVTGEKEKTTNCE